MRSKKRRGRELVGSKDRKNNQRGASGQESQVKCEYAEYGL